MLEYNRIDVENIFAVDRIVTIYFIEISGSCGESHDFWEMLYLDKGNVTVMLDGQPYQIDEGEAIFYAPNVYHSGVKSNDGSKVAVISFESHSNMMSIFTNQTVKLNAEAKKILSEIIMEGTKYFEDYDGGQKLKEEAPEYLLQYLKNHIELLLINIAYQNKASIPQRPSNIENRYRGLSNKIYCYLNKHISERITIDMICNDFAISRSQVKKIFKEEFGCGIIELFNNLKIEEAKRLIRESSMSFSEISEYLAFNSIYYFSELFKRKTGMTPSQYSRSIKQ